jgi:sodium/potassium-transporting ATPase subunit alpha
MASIKNMLPDDCLVIRDGTQKSIRSTEIVPGDLIRITAGDKLPADVRFVQTSSDVKFDRSILTGDRMQISGLR